VKAREDGRIVSVAVVVAVAVNSDGRREVLGMAIGASEAETFWTEFLRKLARRGLRGIMPMRGSRRPLPKSSTPPSAKLLPAGRDDHAAGGLLAAAQVWQRSGLDWVDALSAVPAEDPGREFSRQSSSSSVNPTLRVTW
jgi:Transposase, Mutator family